MPTDYEADDQPATALPDISLDPNEQLPPVYNEGDQIAQNNNSNTQVASLDTTTNDAGPGYVVPDYTGPAISEEKPSWFNPPSAYEPPPAYEPPTYYDPPSYYDPPPAYEPPTYYDPPSYYEPLPVYEPPAYEPPSYNFDYYTPWTPDSNSGMNDSSYYTPWEAPSYSYDPGPSYYDPGPSSSYDSSSSSSSSDSSSSPSFDFGWARGGGVGSCVAEAMKRTQKYARGGPVAKSARMVLSKKA